MECEQMLHDLSSTHKAPITEWHSYDMEAASILNIENEQRLEVRTVFVVCVYCFVGFHVLVCVNAPHQRCHPEDSMLRP